jgi:hypothetical protein
MNSVLRNLAIYVMIFFELAKGILKKLDNYNRSTFFKQGDEHKKNTY